METPFVIDDRDTPRFRVNRRAMVESDVLTAERQRIFDGCWLYLGHESEIPHCHDFKARTVGGRPLIFCRDHEGQVRAFVNSCPHRGAVLCRERGGNARFLKCVYHAWSFDTSGALVAMPDDEAYGSGFDRQNLGLASPRSESYRGFVFVCYDDVAPDLATYLGNAREYLDLVCDQSTDGLEVLSGTHEYCIQANWKLLIENSLDGYHGLPVHQRYFAMAQAAAAGVDGGEDRLRQLFLGPSYGADLGGGHACLGTLPASRAPGGVGRPVTSRSAQAAWEARRRRQEERFGPEWTTRMYGLRNLLVFPNLMVIDLVGGTTIRVIEPVTPGYSEVTAWELAPRDEDPELRALRLDNYLSFWGPGGMASPDDNEVLERCQQGFAGHRELPWSDISRGMVRDVARNVDEYHIRTFWREWNRRITGEQLPPEPHGLPAGAEARRPATVTA